MLAMLAMPEKAKTEGPMSKRNLFLSIGALALIAAVTVTYVSQDTEAEPTAETTVLAP